MDTPTVSNDDRSDAPDIFDMDRTHEAQPRNPGTTSGMQRARPAGSGLLARIGARYFVALAVAASAVWIAWPDTTGGPRPATNSSVLNTQLMSPPQSDALATAKRTGTAITPSREPAAPAAALPATMTTDHADSRMDEQIVQAQAQQAAALVAAIDSLGSRLSKLEARLDAAEKSKTTSVVPSADEKKAPAQQRQRSTKRTGTIARSAPPPVLDGYSLNTIYTGQAWIARDQHMRVVRQGDVMDGFRILSIDARAHQVMTSRGLIR